MFIFILIYIHELILSCIPKFLGRKLRSTKRESKEGDQSFANSSQKIKARKREVAAGNKQFKGNGKY